MLNVSRVDLIGREREPLATIDDFASDPDALRAVAVDATFAPAGEHYPGLRAPLPPGYLAAQMPVVARVVSRAFAGAGASTSSTPPSRS